MSILVIVSLCLVLVYLTIFSLLSYGFRLKGKRGVLYPPAPISIIIPFRNEESNLAQLVDSFLELNYNLNIVEFIFIDDHSSDNSYQILSVELKKTSLIYKIIKQPESKTGKKQAIETAINNSKNDFIVTTDADSTPSKNWLQAYSNAFQNKNQFIIGPVINKNSNHFLGRLHSIEALMLSGVTIGSASLNKPLICSGANLGYTKTLFNELNPYQSNSTIASGDDLFFLDHILQTGKKISYLKNKDAVVYTHAHESYRSLLNQAIRWNSKNGQLTQKLNLYLSILVFFTNLFLIPNLFFGLTGSPTSLLFLFIKLLSDIILFSTSASFYGQLKLIFYTPFIYFFYPIHLLIIFVSSLFVSGQWKGRTIVKNER